MPAYFFNVTDSERQNILDQHKKPYDGLRTMGWESKNPQTLYVQDFANDKMGVTINSKGEVKEYTNTKIHEQIEEQEKCEQCGNEMENLEELTSQEEGLDDVEDLNPSAEFDYVGGADNETDTYEGMDEEISESLELERTTIMEMFQRMKVI